MNDKIVEINLDNWLSESAKVLTNVVWKNTVLEYYEDKGVLVDLSKNPFMEYKGSSIRPGFDKNDYSRSRYQALCQYLGTLVHHIDKEVHAGHFMNFAQLINKAVEKDLIGFGCLMKPFKMEICGMDYDKKLITIDRHGNATFVRLGVGEDLSIPQKPYIKRTMLAFYPYMSASLVEDRHELKDKTIGGLNEYLGANLFMNEGDLPKIALDQIFKTMGFDPTDPLRI